MIRSIFQKIVPGKIQLYIYRQFSSVNLLSKLLRIKVYSHPRSGTHFLEAFLGRNFYPKDNLSWSNVPWGHWSYQKRNNYYKPYGQLFGHHRFPTEDEKNNKQPMIYIYRDPRAVALSIWKIEKFINQIYRGISFSDFLRLKLDWHGTPSIKSEPKWTVAEHWYHHVHSWHQLDNQNLLIIRYEDLKDNPEEIYNQILKKFFPFKNYLIEKKILKKTKIDPISKPLGLLPNAALKDAWKEVFTSEDEQFFLGQIPDLRYLKK